MLVEVAEQRGLVEDGASPHQELGDEDQGRWAGREAAGLVVAAASVGEEEEEEDEGDKVTMIVVPRRNRDGGVVHC